MSEIIPAILAETPEQYQAQIEKVKPFATRLHIDFTDGEFAPHATIKPSEIWWPDGCEADVHAMVRRPEDVLSVLVHAKPRMVLFHAEAEGDLPAVFVTLQQYGIKAGLVLLRKTVPANVANLISLVDHVMIFAGELGSYGGKAHMMQLEKVRLIKKINPMVEIGWDGGVSLDNAYSLVQGGVDILNVGGAIQFADDAEMMYKNLVTEINRHGIL
ncbi:MAG: hypothetical protein Q4B06_00355 [Candidatus Saccharibacteria bacterium]|nr:hypothetical protein [Candidatus Saccharibacteria bacterium]